MSEFENRNILLKEIALTNSYFSIRSVIEEHFSDEKFVRLYLRKLLDWFQQTPSQIQQIKIHFHQYFLQTSIKQSILIDLLLNQLQTKFDDYFIYLLIDFYEKNFERLFQQLEYEYNSSYLIHLPDRISNCCQMNIPNCFQIKVFFSKLSHFIQQQLENIHYLNLKKQINTDIRFLSQLIHKASKLGYTEYIWRPLYKNFFRKTCLMDPIWIRLIQNILFEPIDHILFYTIEHSNASILDRILSDRILHQINLETYIIDVLLFRKQIRIDSVRTILIYLLKSPQRKEKYIEKIFLHYLQIWSEESFIRLTSNEQHFYICQCLCLCLSFHQYIQLNNKQDEIIINILNGIRRHLESTFDYIRFRGQFLGELIIERIEIFDQSNQLQFNTYDKNHTDIQLLKNLAEKNSELNDRDLSDDDDDEEVVLSKPTIDSISIREKSNTIVLRQASTDDDDDDEFETYDYSHDTVKSDIRKPSYIRSCLADLIATDKVSQLEVALQMLPTLIEMYKIESEEVALELTRILLNYNSTFNIDNFEQMQLNGLITLCTNYPLLVSHYLCKQFYERNYTISQRSLILRTIQESAKKLSDIEQIKKKIENNLEISDDDEEDESWRTIVDKRLKLKTKKRFSQKTIILTKDNRFGQIVGYFFYPLITSIDQTSPHLSLIDGDHDYLLLCELLACLGRLCIHAQNTSVVMKMLKEYLQVLKSLQKHINAGVRHAIVYAYACCLVSINNQYVDEDLQMNFIELKQWLDEIILRDTNTEVQKLGKSVRRILLKTLQEITEK